MIDFVGKTIKKVEISKGMFYMFFEDGSMGAVSLYLSNDLSKECANELHKSIANKETRLFTILRDKF